MNERRKIDLVPVAPSGSVTEVPEALAGPPPPEPVYEYQVVCADTGTPSAIFLRYDRAVDHAKAVGELKSHGAHDHEVERRSVGPWEAT